MSAEQDHGAAVRLRCVTSGYQLGTPVITDLTVDLPGRGLTNVRGRNGSGKSTLLELYSGYLRPWQGTVEVCGHPASSPGARLLRRTCRTRSALYPHMTAQDHLHFASRCVGTDPGAALVRAERHGLGPWLGYAAAALSTGNARKLWYLMCTLGEFAVAFLDEPFNGLDEEGVAVVRDELRAWAATGAVLLISHALPPDVRPDAVFTLTAAHQGVEILRPAPHVP